MQQPCPGDRIGRHAVMGVLLKLAAKSRNRHSAHTAGCAPYTMSRQHQDFSVASLNRRMESWQALGRFGQKHIDQLAHHEHILIIHVAKLL